MHFSFLAPEVIGVTDEETMKNKARYVRFLLA